MQKIPRSPEATNLKKKKILKTPPKHTKKTKPKENAHHQNQTQPGSQDCTRYVQGVGLVHLRRTLPTAIILWFRDSSRLPLHFAEVIHLARFYASSSNRHTKTSERVAKELHEWLREGALTENGVCLQRLRCNSSRLRARSTWLCRHPTSHRAITSLQTSHPYLWARKFFSFRCFRMSGIEM